MTLNISRDTDAVSAVVAMMLILTILTTFITAINAYYIPSLAAEHEIKHMQDVQTSFVEIAAEAGSESSGPGSKIRIPLGDGGLPLMGTLSTSGSLTVAPDKGWINISLYNASEKKRMFSFEINSSYLIQNVTSVSSVVLAMTKPYQYDTFVLECGGNSSASLTYDPNGYLKLGSYENNSSVFSSYIDTPIPWSPVPQITFSVDMLVPSYRFDRILGNVQAPFNLTLYGNRSGVFYLDYEKINYTDSEKGRLIDQYSMNVSTGYFRYSSSNNFWMDQDLIFENGAIILEQGSRSSVRSQPFITVDESRNLLTLCAFDIEGDRESVSGNGESTVNICTGERKEYLYSHVENTSVSIYSEYPEAWDNYLSSIADLTVRDNNTISAYFYNRTVDMSTTSVVIVIP
ncbi:MAG: hypothetical protein K8R64_00830 [Methanosarcinaceae archaeon]|nr:hypothetical protein [Methanosarcinaceae archaeon]